jgi:hypothetical protein
VTHDFRVNTDRGSIETIVGEAVVAVAVHESAVVMYRGEHRKA